MTPNVVMICCLLWLGRAIELVMRWLHSRPIDALRMQLGRLPTG